MNVYIFATDKLFENTCYYESPDVFSVHADRMDERTWNFIFKMMLFDWWSKIFSLDSVLLPGNTKDIGKTQATSSVMFAVSDGHAVTLAVMTYDYHLFNCLIILQNKCTRKFSKMGMYDCFCLSKQFVKIFQ